MSDNISQSEQQSTQGSITFEQVTKAHKLWFKRLVGLGAIEAKIWVASSAQLVALMCAVAVLLVTTWLMLIAAVAAVAWSYGFSLMAILSVGALVSLISAVVLLSLVNRTLSAMNFTRTLDALIPSDDESHRPESN